MGNRLSGSNISRAAVYTGAALLVLLSFATCAAAGPSSIPDSSAWATLGSTFATCVAPDGTVYVGGDFTYVGPLTGGCAAVSQAGDLVGAPLGGSCVTYGRVPDGHGGLYISGDFSSVAGQPRQGIAHIATDGSLDPAFFVEIGGTGIAGRLALSPDGSTLYLAGAFSSVGGVARDRLAAVRTSDGAVTAWEPPTPNVDPNDGIGGIAVSPDGATVYIYCGGFTSIGGEVRHGLAAVDATTGLVTSWDPQAVSDNGDAMVYTLALSPDGATVYVAGSFVGIGGAVRNRLAAIDATTGAATSWAPDVIGGQVFDLVPSQDGSTVYAVGSFSSIGGAARAGVVALDATTGLATAWNPSVVPHEGYAAGMQALCLSPDGSIVYVGGWFAGVGDTIRNNLAAIDAASGSVTDWDPGAGDTVGTLVASGSTVYVGANSVGGLVRNGLAAFDGVTGAVTDWDPNVAGSVQALSVAPDGATVYAGGDIRSIGGVPRRNIAAIDATTGATTGWTPEADAVVLTLAASGSVVYAGGQFSAIGGQARSCIAALDPATGAATEWNPDASRWVNALVVSGSTVYVAGGFNSIGGRSRMRIAALDVATGSATGWNPRGDADGGIRTLAVTGSIVYAGGDFQSMGGLTRRNLAAIDRTSGEVTSWAPNASGGVFALAVSPDGSTIYAGGDFTSIGGATRRYLGAVSAFTGAAAEWNPEPDAPVYSLRIAPAAPAAAARSRAASAASGTLLAGGRFSSVHGQVRPGLAVFPSAPRVRLLLAKSPSGSRYAIVRKAGAAYFTFTVTAKKVSGEVIRGQTVRLQSSTNGTSWKTKYTLSTNSRGKATKRASFTRAGAAYWRWYSPSNEWYNAASSSKTRIVVR